MARPKRARSATVRDHTHPTGVPPARRRSDRPGPSSGNGRPRAQAPLSQGQVTRLLLLAQEESTGDNLAHRHFVVLALVTYLGLEWDQVVQLRWGQFEPKRRRLAGRRLPPKLIKVLAEWRGTIDPALVDEIVPPLVSVTAEATTLSQDYDPIRLRHFGRELGIPGLSFHQLSAFQSSRGGPVRLPEFEASRPPKRPAKVTLRLRSRDWAKDPNPLGLPPSMYDPATDTIKVPPIKKPRFRPRFLVIPEDAPPILVRGKPHWPTPAELNVLRALKQAGADGLSLTELEGMCGVGAITTLKRLAKKPGFAEVIRLAGRPYGRYRLIDPGR